LQEIMVRTKRRFRRFERLSSGTQVLIDLIEERLGVQVEYNFDDDLLRIKDPSGFTDWFYFDELAQLTADYAAKTGRDPGQFALAAMLQGVLDDRDQPEIKVFLRYNGKVVIFYKDEVVCYHDTLEEFMKISFHKVLELRNNILGKHDN
jgi:hypothetical protein